MKTYYVYNHPLYGQRIEENGSSFTLLGLLFTAIWLVIKKLYLIAALTCALFLITSVADKIVNDLMLSEINTVLSTPLSELYENDRYREIYLTVVDPEVVPWEINKARSKPKFIDPFTDTAIQGESEVYDPFSSKDPVVKDSGLADVVKPEISNNPIFVAAAKKKFEEGLLDRAKPATFAYALEQIKDLEVISYLIWTPAIALQILIGFNGRGWVIRSLTRRGFELTDTLQAHTKDAVLAQLARKAAPATAST